MKNLIEDTIRYYPDAFPRPIDVLVHIFTVNGNGLSLNTKGYIEDNYKCSEPFLFSEPEPLTYVYPWPTDQDFQPFRELAGCRDVGFKEAVQYFIECLKVTPDTLEDIQEWKNQIPLIEEVLLHTPTIEDEYSDIQSGYEKFLTKIDFKDVTANRGGRPEVLPKSVEKIWFLNTQWSDCPTFVEKEVKEIWQTMGFGNDHYFYKCSLNSELFDQYPNIYYWLKYSGVPENETVLINWWW